MQDKTVLDVHPITKEEYAAFAAGKDYNMYQHPKFIQFMEDRGFKPKIYGGFENGRLVIAMIVRIDPLMKLFKSARALREWISDTPADPELIKAFIHGLVPLLKQEGAAWLKLESGVEYQQRDAEGNVVTDGFNNESYRQLLAQTGFHPEELWTNGLDMTHQARWVSVLDLVERETPEDGMMHTSEFMKNQPGIRHKSVGDVFKGFSMKIPRHIREGMQDFIVVRELEMDEMEIMHKLEEASAEVHDFQAPDLATYQAWKKAFGDDCIVVASFLDTNRYRDYLDRELSKGQADLEQAHAELAEVPGSKKRKNKVNSVLEHLRPVEKRARELDELVREYGEMIPLAGGLFVITPAETIYLFGGSIRSLSQFFGPQAVQFEMIRRSIERGALRYNFWGISGKFRPDEEGYGVYKYKKEFGAHVVEYAGEFTMVLRPAVARLTRLNERK
ncbi:peptidoglycan bridge formation glycyltransferase FemA/FemB family protein [uncultured Faecalibaculum sp.]|uniref:peptidoglycan bridge formation glycyltransferase FemA/FemB family protein n=1 Tax=uncultured Faecalibaculum sp. TaxID=1729681 RepID=UPI002617646C|nr:peptidoglycan bridge formation glycyltransferase FemA/FemB family protein [uncultured Faecalibaculum sp.]